MHVNNHIHKKPATTQPAANGFSRYKDRVLVSKARIAYVLGDLHGDYRSFHKAKFLFLKAEPDAVQLFLGDYPNRGSKGVEIITDLNAMLGGASQASRETTKTSPLTASRASISATS